MYLQAVLVMVLVLVNELRCSAEDWPLPTPCEPDDPMCISELTVDNRDQCYQYDVRNLCCYKCSALRNNAKPECPWGDHRHGVVGSDYSKTYRCEDIAPSTCIYCTTPLRKNCCHSCEEICGPVVVKRSMTQKAKADRMIRVLKRIHGDQENI